jgi:hypothetical protein
MNQLGVLRKYLTIINAKQTIKVHPFHCYKNTLESEMEFQQQTIRNICNIQSSGQMTK